VKYSELKRTNEALVRENFALKSMHIAQLRDDPGQLKKLAVSVCVSPLEQLRLGKEGVARAAQQAAGTLAHFLVKEGVIKPQVMKDKKTDDKFIVFEIKVVP
jgi:hypothetical protein